MKILYENIPIYLKDGAWYFGSIREHSIDSFPDYSRSTRKRKGKRVKVFQVLHCPYIHAIYLDQLKWYISKEPSNELMMLHFYAVLN